MRKVLFGVTAGLFALATAGTGVAADQIEGVNVEASRIVKEQVGRAPNLAPINAISLSYRVSYADLDLATPAGAAALEKRVNDAAEAACKEIGRLYPLATPDDLTCTKAAVKEAMVKVKEVQAAAKAPKK